MSGFHHRVFIMLLLLFHNLLNSYCCLALNHHPPPQGMALLRFREKVESDPFGALSTWNDPHYYCSWFGVHCSASAHVVSIHLQDLCLSGTLAPEIHKLTHLKSLILRNNSFSGNIPREIAELNELEVLDLGFNNFSGPFPSRYLFLNNPTLLLDNNKLLDLDAMSSEAHDINIIDRKTVVQNGEAAAQRMLLLQESPFSFPPSEAPFSSSLPPSSSSISAPSPSPTESPTSLSPAIAPSSSPPNIAFVRPQHRQAPSFSNDGYRPKLHHHHTALIAGIVGGSLFMLLSVIGLTFIRSNKVVTVRPWATGLSGQLQRAFVTGVPKLKRWELEAACEDFSNIIGSFVDGTVYKGTLSSGVEIAVTSVVGVSSKRDWSKVMEARFRKKIATLSKVNHKNFVNLIGFCEEDEPFTRMMVFEYAPNGTLFEHLHVKEAEHLDWGTRLRIAMGMAYCLEHMHQLTPPIYHETLRSSSVYLTEDYAGKISDFCFWNDVTAAKMGSSEATIEILESPPADAESNVYSFGMLLLELITGRIPYTSSSEDGSLTDWASNHLREDQPLGKMVDPTLKAFQQVELEKLVDLIRNCIHPDPKTRLSMRDVAERLREITSMDPARATPRLSPLWWAELEIMSTDGC
ncbi:Protein MALE DISCOVERER 1 [Linum perenne]